MKLEKEYKATMVGLHKYMMNKEDPQIQAVLRHQTAKDPSQYQRKLRPT